MYIFNTKTPIFPSQNISTCVFFNYMIYNLLKPNHLQELFFINIYPLDILNSEGNQ